MLIQRLLVSNLFEKLKNEIILLIIVIIIDEQFF